jgi:hypothetical protein
MLAPSAYTMLARMESVFTDAVGVVDIWRRVFE